MRRLACTLAVMNWACATQDPGIDPPLDALFFPAGLAVDPDGRFLYVSNANANLRYNEGTIVALDLCRVGDLRDELTACAGVPPAALVPHLSDPTDLDVVYHPEAKLIASAVRVGSFAGAIAARPDGQRLYFGVRSAPRALVYVDVAAGVLDCGQASAGGGRCAADHETTSAQPIDEVTPPSLAPEPFGLAPIRAAADDTFVLVTHLSVGVVSLVEDLRGTVGLVGASPEIFGEDPLAPGRRGAFALAPMPGADSGITVDARGVPSLARSDGPVGPFYVSSRVSPEVATVFLDRPRAPGADGLPVRDVIEGPHFFVRPALADGSDARGLVFAPDGSRLYVVDRRPPALVEVDTTTNPDTGRARNAPDRVAELCAEPSLARLRVTPSGRTLVYVVCYQTAQVYVVDTATMEVTDVIATGRGPDDLEFYPDPLHAERAFLTHFAENTVGEIDLDETSPTYHRLVRRLGEPEPLR